MHDIGRPRRPDMHRAGAGAPAESHHAGMQPADPGTSPTAPAEPRPQRGEPPVAGGVAAQLARDLDRTRREHRAALAGAFVGGLAGTALALFLPVDLSQDIGMIWLPLGIFVIGFGAGAGAGVLISRRRQR